ncbi:MAG: peptidoglycan DD-metalloendopeptidase family protein [Gammaproteobacteria bacterium]|nr:peptidoglycan DD-metalloendopeptidase family protein [Gammaproteobacteria bacterium]
MSVGWRGGVALTVAAAVAALVLPACTQHSRAPVADRSAATEVSARPNTYMVIRGDSLYAIAWRYQLDYRDLAAANNIRDPYIIYPGDVLNLRVIEGARFRASPSAPAQSPPTTARRSKAPPAQTADRTKPTTTTRRQPGKPPQVAGPTSKPAKPPPRGKPAATPATRVTAAASRSANAAPPARAGATRGWRHPVGVRPTQGFGRGSLGQDYVLTPGARVYSASGGVVMYAGPGLGGFRHLVIVKVSNQYLAAYGLNVAPVVREGEAVEAGQVLAAIDGDGALSRRFHFEVRRDGKPVDPKPLIGS